MLTKFAISGLFFSRFLSIFQHLKVIKFSSLKQQQIYGSVILSRSRTSAILAQFFLIHVVYEFESSFYWFANLTIKYLTKTAVTVSCIIKMQPWDITLNTHLVVVTTIFCHEITGEGALNFHFGIGVWPEEPNRGDCEWTTAKFGTFVNWITEQNLAL